MARPVETPEYAAMIRRMLRAYGRRVADADPEDLEALLALRCDLDAAIVTAIAGQRTKHGRSWTDIARAAGTTRQAAYARWASLVDALTA